MTDKEENVRAFSDGTDPNTSYFTALGRFIDAFAQAEMTIQFVLWYYAKTPLKIARVVFSGGRVDAASRHLTRLAEVGIISPEDWLDLEPTKQQLNIISGQRNELLHYGSHITPGREERIVTNAMMALTEERITSFPISPKILGQMTADLHKITLHFHVRHMGHSEMVRKNLALDKILHSAWQYKPPEQAQNRRKPHGSGPKQPRQP
jgi:hypothetical protein